MKYMIKISTSTNPTVAKNSRILKLKSSALLFGPNTIKAMMKDPSVRYASALAMFNDIVSVEETPDMVFGYIVDRHTFRNGQKFLPWIRIGTTAIGITTVVLFAIPQAMTDTAKVVWFLVAYILFDMSYTILDTPAFAVTTVMTPDVSERTDIIAGGKLWAMVGGVIATVLVPVLRPMLGWLGGCVVFVAVSVILMIPMLFFVKERHSETVTAEQNPGLEDMLHYLKNNRYLIVALVAMLLLGVASLEQKMAIYMGRICLGQENTATLVAGGAAIAVIVVSAVVPALSKKWDKIYVLCAGLAFSIVMDAILQLWCSHIHALQHEAQGDRLQFGVFLHGYTCHAAKICIT